MAGVVPVSNETRASLARTTRDGRELLYQITIIQQPERARACGSGAKSSADRRPVDPPPVVELKIFEGPEKMDVTFGYNANFFLFTTLEPARQINHGRVPIPAQSTPVLTGAPVAGMVYLDRPTPAGYFIFPDLSVRHEGMYRLSFSLYEDVKEEKDEDPLPVGGSPTMKLNGAMAARAQVHFRLEVKSEAFSVFSAKKFPGLAESTNLSRTVAEQGCRVRIRREVRLRRREKGSDNYQNVCDEGQYAASDRYSTPQHLPDRPRSISNASMDAPPPYAMGRRPSVHEPPYYPQNNYQQAPPPPPAAPQTGNSYTSHLNFGGQTTPTYPKPSIPAPPPMSAPQHYPPPNNFAQYPPPHPHARQSSAPRNYNYSPVTPQSTPYHAPQMIKEEVDRDVDHRRASSGSTITVASLSGFDALGIPRQHPQDVPPQPAARALTPINTNTQNYQQNQSNTLPSVTSLLQQAPAGHQSEPVSANSGMPQGPQNPFSATSLSSYSTSSNVTPHSSHPANADPLSSRIQTPYSSTSDQANRLQSPYASVNDQASRLSKRSYGNVFDTSHFNQPQHSGSRPDPVNYAQDIQKIETDDGDLADMYEESLNTLVYKRANGTQQARKCPSPRDRRRGPC